MMNRAVKLLLSLAAVVCAAVILLKIPSFIAPLLPPKEKPKPTAPYKVNYTAEIVRRDLPNLVETSNLIAIVTVADEPESFCVRYGDSGGVIFSEQTAKIERVFMGDDTVETVAVRQTGGTVGLRTEYYTENPVLKTGNRYLLFLYQPDMGGRYNTEGDYYYIRGSGQGVFTIVSDGSYRPFRGATITEEELTDAISNGPAVPYSTREEYLANQKHNYENGTITKERYEQNIALVDEYAVIIPDDEAPWH